MSSGRTGYYARHSGLDFNEVQYFVELCGFKCLCYVYVSRVGENTIMSMTCQPCHMVTQLQMTLKSAKTEEVVSLLPLDFPAFSRCIPSFFPFSFLVFFLPLLPISSYLSSLLFFLFPFPVLHFLIISYYFINYYLLIIIFFPVSMSQSLPPFPSSFFSSQFLYLLIFIY